LLSIGYWCLCFITIVFKPFNMTMGRIKRAANLVSDSNSLIGNTTRNIIIFNNPKNILQHH
jgi:hypothetical protein